MRARTIRQAGALVSTFVFLLLSSSATHGATLRGVVTDRDLHRIAFETEAGGVTLNLPADMARGDRITGSVIANPQGRSESERGRNRTALEAYSVEIGDTSIGARARHATWEVPPTDELPVLLRDGAGRVVARGSVPVLASAGPRATAFELPEFAQSGDALTVPGPFDGAADNTALRIGDRRAPVLAESPRATVVEVPGGLIGEQPIVVEEGAETAESSLRVASLAMSAGDLRLRPGETTTLTVAIDGLSGLEGPLPLTLRNESPEVVTLEGPEILVIDPGNVDSAGQFVHRATLTGITEGGFAIEARVRQPHGGRLMALAPPSGSILHDVNPVLRWRPSDIPEATYSVTVSELYDAEGLPLGALDAPWSAADSRVIFSAEGLTGTELRYPTSAPPLAGARAYAWTVAASIAGDDFEDPNAESGPLVFTISERCRCPRRFGGTALEGELRIGGERIMRAPLERNPSGTLELPPGPISLTIVDSRLRCSVCGEEECDVAGAAYAPDPVVLMPLDGEKQTQTVTATWNCESEDCEDARGCTKDYKLKYWLVDDDCHCGEIRASVTVRNSAPGRLGEATYPLICTEGGERPTKISVHEDLRVESGDRLEVEIDDFGVGCWCNSGLCRSTPTEKADLGTERPLSVRLSPNGDNVPAAINDNSNARHENASWNDDDNTYSFGLRVRDENTNSRNAFQNVQLRTNCVNDTCSDSICQCTWQLVLGRF